ncbi:MAG TPA: carbohydrate ABC transporter permease [Spirochaetia bacterium]|nr:carbohydrate ABC transporter permease [Spirochaetia bacterium]
MNRHRTLRIILNVITVCMLVVWLLPVLWGLTTSLKQETQTLAVPPVWLPNPVSLHAYAAVLAIGQLSQWYLNSVVTTVIITVSVVLLSMLAAYALSQLKFPGKNLLYWLFLAAFMVPPEALIIPLFLQMNSLNMVNTYGGIILPQLVSVLGIIILKQFYDQVPHAYRDSMNLDGAGEFRILFNLYVPLNWSITWAIVIVTFIGGWNNFFWPFIVATSTDMMTIPVGITQVQSAYGVYYAQQMAVAVLAALPIVVVYLIFQRRVTLGVMATSGLKG